MKISLRRITDSYRNPWRRVFYASLRRWRKENGNEKRFQLGVIAPEDTVFDLGGFEGSWTERQRSAYRCQVHVFEPHPGFAEALRRKFAAEPDVVVHEFALAGVSGSFPLSDDGDASSALTGRGKTVVAQKVSVAEFFAANPVERIRVAKINIEGGEYDVVPALVEQGVIDRFGAVRPMRTRLSFSAVANY